MKNYHREAQAGPAKNSRKLRQPRIVSMNFSPLDGNHNSLRKLVEQRVLPPLHPQTDVKKTGIIAKNCCPEEFQESVPNTQILKLGHSEQMLLGQTPKFPFDKIVIGHLEKQQDKMLTISYDQSNRIRKKSQLGITFGKLVQRLENHRYTLVQDRHEEKERKRRPLVDISNLVKLSKCENIFRPNHKEKHRASTEITKDYALPPISSKNI